MSLLSNNSSLLDHPLCKGISVLQPTRFNPCPFGYGKSQAVQGFDIWKFCLALFTKFVAYLGEEISDFRLCCGLFPPTEIGTYF